LTEDLIQGRPAGSGCRILPRLKCLKRIDRMIASNRPENSGFPGSPRIGAVFSAAVSMDSVTLVQL
jgi:hypothetical protein